MDDFETKAVRVFYRKSDNQVIWTHELKVLKGSSGKFPTTIKDDLNEIPLKMPDGITPLGGVPDDYGCIEVTESTAAKGFLSSDNNKVADGKLVIGTPRITPIPVPPRDLVAEIDKLKERIAKLEK